MTDVDRTAAIGGSISGGLWTVQSTGDWAADNRIGAEFARGMIEDLRRSRRCVPILGHIVREIVDAGRMGGVEVGFFHHIATVLSSGVTPQ